MDVFSCIIILTWRNPTNDFIRIDNGGIPNSNLRAQIGGSAKTYIWQTSNLYIATLQLGTACEGSQIHFERKKYTHFSI